MKLESGASGMSVSDIRELVEEMNKYYRARAPWHDGYMGYTGNAAMEELLGPIVARVKRLLVGLDVLEVACGTGNWTQVLAGCSRRVLATDINETTLSRARTKDYVCGVVRLSRG